MNEESEISNKILDLIQKNNPETVESLIEQTEKTLGITKKTALEQIIILDNKGKLNLINTHMKNPSTFPQYVISSGSLWFMLTIGLSFTTAITFLLIPDSISFFFIVRYVLGSAFLFILPGFSLIKTLYPTKEIDEIERIALSIGTSIVIYPIIGVLLNFSPWGIRRTSITLGMLLLIIILATTGLLREYHEKIERQIQA